MNRRKKILLGGLLLAMMAVAVTLYGYYTDRKKSAQLARNDLKKCQLMASKIQAHKNRPNLAAEHEKERSETTSIIEKASQKAGISTSRVLLISPGAATRIGETSYKEKPTAVDFTDITLRQLTQFLYNIISGDNGLHIKSLRITAPGRQEAGGHWKANVILTYLIYEPLNVRKVR